MRKTGRRKWARKRNRRKVRKKGNRKDGLQEKERIK
jgi:hypothetical protein